MSRSKCRLSSVLLLSIMLLAPHALAGGSDSKTIAGAAEAKLEKDAHGLYLKTHSKSYELAQFAYGEVDSKTVLVEGDATHRWLVNDDIGANGDQTGTVKLTIYPIHM